MGPGDFDDHERLALLNLLTEAIESDPYPLSPRVQLYRQILARFGPIGGLPPPPPPAKRPTPAEQDPRRRPRGQGRRR